MAAFPFIFPVLISITTNSTNTAVFGISAGETYKVKRIYSSLNTAGLAIFNIRDQRGRAYMQGSTTNVVPLAQVGNSANANETNVFVFDEPLIVEPNGTLYVDVQNTTGGTLAPTIILVGTKEIGVSIGA